VYHSASFSFALVSGKSGIVSSGLEMARDRFTLFQQLCFKRSAEGPKSGFQRGKMAVYVHLGLQTMP
jgi:hypothetical protein